MTHAPATALAVDHWQRLGLRIRLALQPDEPRLIGDFLDCGEDLVAHHGHPAWQLHDRSLDLLLSTAYDLPLPIVWRLTCLDACCRPIGQLGRLVHDDASALRLRLHARRLASFTYRPHDARDTP